MGTPGRLSPVDDDTVLVVVEIPRGSRNKYEFDHDLGAIRLDRMLFTSMVYPADYGFIEGTLGGDGDALDALVFVGEPTFPGCRIVARPVGLFRMEDEKGADEKILCVPLSDPAWSYVQDLADLRENLLAEVEHFFGAYGALEDKTVKSEGFGPRSEARQVIDEARARVSPSRTRPHSAESDG